MPTRCMSMAAVLLGILLLAGCRSADPGEPPWVDAGKVGLKGRDTARARSRYMADEIKILSMQQQELVTRRRQLLDDAREYGKMSSAAWSDPGIPISQRAAHADQYMSRAHDSKERARAYAELLRMYEESMGPYDSNRVEYLLRAERLEKRNARGLK